MPILKDDFKALKKLDQRSKVLVVLFLLFLFLLGILLGALLFGPGRSATPTPQVVITPPSRPTTSLSLLPSSQTIKVGEALPVSLTLTGEPVQAVDVVLTFDPKVFNASQIKKGELFPMMLRQNIKPGTIEWSASVTPENPTATTSGEVFSFILTALSSTSSANVDFDSEKTITAKGGKNTLGLTVGGRYTVE